MPFERDRAVSNTLTGNSSALNAIQIQIFSLTSFILRYMSSFSFTAFAKNQEIFTLLFLASSIGIFRHLCNSLWQRFLNALFLTAHIHHPDEAYSWMMIWLSRHNGSTLNTREVQICTGNWGLTYHKNVAISPDAGNSHQARLLSYLPAFGVKQWMKYRGTWMSVYRTKDLGQTGNRTFQYETIVLSLFTRDWRILQRLLQEARDCYKSYEENLVCVYGINKDNFSWTRISEKAKRPLSTIILPAEIKDALLNDLKAFLSNESWYIEKGIPFRRGYLLYGVPGSGKSSLIHGIAGELNLSIYMISLSIKDLDDSTLCRVINQVPAGSAIVFEDLDVLSPHPGTIHHRNRTPAVNSGQDSEPMTTRHESLTLTLSGLLNGLDGLSAQEGRIVFATSNRYYDLDPALRRPGRLDRHFEFYNATQQQVKELYTNFYRHLDNHDDNIIPLSETTDGAEAMTTVEKSEESVNSAELDILATVFSQNVPDKTFSMAMIQEYLVQYKYQPRAAVSKVEEWVKEEMSKLEVL